ILASTDEDTRSAIQGLIREEEEGVLARDPATGLFEIISDADLQAILENSDDLPKTRRPADVTLEPVTRREGNEEELSLVSTQVLRKILKKDSAKAPSPAKDKLPRDKGGGFDPYNSG